MSWLGDWQHYKLDPDQSSFMSLCVIGEEGQKTVVHGSRRNIKKHVVEVVKLGEKIKNSDVVDFLLGCHIAVLQLCPTIRPVHCS